MGTKYTPGVWNAKYLSGAGWQIHADIKSHLGEKYSNEYPICQNEAIIAYDPWRQWPRAEFDDMQEANIKLMAAAPELLDALQEAYSQVKELCQTFRVPYPESSFERYEAAIDKATKGV